MWQPYHGLSQWLSDVKEEQNKSEELDNSLFLGKNRNWFYPLSTIEHTSILTMIFGLTTKSFCPPTWICFFMTLKLLKRQMRRPLLLVLRLKSTSSQKYLDIKHKITKPAVWLLCTSIHTAPAEMYQYGLSRDFWRSSDMVPPQIFSRALKTHSFNVLLVKGNTLNPKLIFTLQCLCASFPHPIWFVLSCSWHTGINHFLFTLYLFLFF